MGFAEEMTNLGEKLVASCENRIDGTKKMLNTFHQNHRNMARNQRNNLNEFRENLESNTDKVLRRFRNEHREMAKKQNKELAAFTGELTQSTKGYLKKCHKQQMELHDMFAQAHKNFLHCMREIERKKRNPSARIDREEPRKTPRKKKRTRH